MCQWASVFILFFCFFLIPSSNKKKNSPHSNIFWIKIADCWCCSPSLPVQHTPSLRLIFTPVLHVSPSFSHERSSSGSKGPRHCSAPSGKIIHYASITVHLWSSIGPHRVFFLSCSISRRRQLCTPRAISTIKWRLPARSNAPALWGEHSNHVAWFTTWSLLALTVSSFVPLSRFKISKVIVVGDLAVGKTCLINR